MVTRPPLPAEEPIRASEPVPAGAFGAWLRQARAALRGRQGMQVPCGSCTGCCTSHYAILLRPTDAALDLVSAALLSPAPGLDYPHARLLPRADGTCPMLEHGRCSIYTQRPQTCLDYDCRVFAAAGLLAGAQRPAINARIRAWRFDYEDAAALRAHAAVRAAAAFLRQHAPAFPRNWVPASPSGIAVLAIKAYEPFMADGGDEAVDAATRAEQIVRLIQAFDAQGAAS